MKNNKQIIFSKDWKQFHPYQGSARTDLYYVRLANTIFHALSEKMNTDEEDDFIVTSEEDLTELSCIITSYFEDIISQTNIFATFVSEHQKLYGKPLPFYTPTEYFDHEINTDDIRFLIWQYFIELTNGEIPISPEYPLFADMANAVMEILDEIYESAPENEKLQQFFKITDEDAENLGKLQSKFFWLTTESYLFHGNGLSLQATVEEAVNEAQENDYESDIPMMVNILCTESALSQKTPLLGYLPARWLAALTGESTVAYQNLSTLSHKYTGYFTFESKNEETTNFKHIATGKIVEIASKSLIGTPKELTSPDVILFIGFVRWKNEWWFVGEVRIFERKDEVVDEINSRENEKHLFDDIQPDDYNEEEQSHILSTILKDYDESEDEEEATDIIWSVLTAPDLSVDFVRRAYDEGKLERLRFAGPNGDKLLRENFDFVQKFLNPEG